MYFSSFPKIDYDVKGDGITTRMTDITRRARISDQSVIYGASFDYYDIKDTERAEDIAHRYYGDSKLHWIILMINILMMCTPIGPCQLLDSKGTRSLNMIM